MHNRWLMAKKSLNIIEKMMDPNIIDYYIIKCAIPSIITIENRNQIDFGKPGHIMPIKDLQKLGPTRAEWTWLVNFPYLSLKSLWPPCQKLWLDKFEEF